MNWKKKVEVLTHLSEERPELAMYFAVAPPAPHHFLDELKVTYPFIPESYLELLSITDGIQLHWFALAGSGESQFQSLYALTELVKWRMGGRRMLPIGLDANGDAIVLTESTIELLPQPQYGGPQVLTTDFNELVGEFFLGKKYPLMFDGRPSPEDPWFALLRELRWT